MEHKRRRLSSVLDDDFNIELESETENKSLDNQIDTYTEKICKCIYISLINLISVCFR